MDGVNADEMLEMLRQVRLAIHWHDEWFDGIVRAVICQLPYDPRDVAEAPHRQCQFGQWYYEHADEYLHHHPALIEIEIEHRRMHELGRHFLLTLGPGGRSNPASFDAFRRANDHLHQEMKTLKHEIEDALYKHDALTGAENRVGMYAVLREARELVKRQAQQCAIAIMDLDHFKRINDTHGHPVGDQVLVALIEEVRRQLRPYDRVFRYGGEEFLLYLPSTSVETARIVVERIRREIETNVIETSAPEPIAFTASFGIAELEPGATAEETVQRADQALFAAKHAGRNRTCLWETAMADAGPTAER